MAHQSVPQPQLSRMVPVRGHPWVVGIGIEPAELVVRTAVGWAEALSTKLVFAHVDPNRTVVSEHADGTVVHVGVDPDIDDDGWRIAEAAIRARLAEWLAGTGVEWEFQYLAGRIDRALTHLARAVDAGAIVVGGHRRHHDPLAFLDGSVPARLAVHQHRPVLVIPLMVVDWNDRAPWQ